MKFAPIRASTFPPAIPYRTYRYAKGCIPEGCQDLRMLLPASRKLRHTKLTSRIATGPHCTSSSCDTVRMDCGSEALRLRSAHHMCQSCKLHVVFARNECVCYNRRGGKTWKAERERDWAFFATTTRLGTDPCQPIPDPERLQ